MDLDKLSNGEKIAGVSAILLFIFMFFDWFSAEVSVGGRSASEGASAWDALDVIPIILVIVILVALAVVALRLMDSSSYEPPAAANAIVAALGGLAFILILYRIIDTPGASASLPGFSVDVSPSFGIFLGLISAAGIAYGGYAAMKEEGMTFSDVGDSFGAGGSGRGSRGTAGQAPQPPRSQAPPPPPPAAPQQPPAQQPPGGGEQPPPPPTNG